MIAMVMTEGCGDHNSDSDCDDDGDDDGDGGCLVPFSCKRRHIKEDIY
jgi:hypothetical protein